jgi:hypothetical protein
MFNGVPQSKGEVKIDATLDGLGVDILPLSSSFFFLFNFVVMHDTTILSYSSIALRVASLDISL